MTVPTTVATAQLFQEARTHSAWLDRPVDEATLHQIYDLMKWGPTSVNSSPGRVLFVTSAGAKETLLGVMSPGNVEKTKAAPVSAIIAYDTAFYNALPKLFPHADARAWFVGEGKEAFAQETSSYNAALQAAYFIVAARAVGLDAGPMAGFDKAKLDAAFFAGTTWKSALVVNLGYGDKTKLFPRLPRLDFDEVAKIV